MNQDEQSKAADLRAIERSHFMGGQLPTNTDCESSLYRAHFRDWDARKCESELTRASVSVSGIARLRALIFRGRLNQAAELHAELSRGLPEHGFEAAEAALEIARLACLQGDWKLACERATAALSTQPEPQTRMAILQTRAFALFEQGNFAPAIDDLESVAALSELAAGTPAALTAQLLAIRITARDRGSELADRKLNSLWNKLEREKRLDRYAVTTLLLCELDLAWLARREVLGLALALHRLETEMGELHYADLALTHAFLAAGTEGRSRLAAEAERARSTDIRISRLRTQLESGAPLSSSAAAIAAALDSRRDAKVSLDGEVTLIERASLCTHVAVSRRGISVEVAPWGAKALEMTPLMQRTLSSLRTRRVGKEVFLTDVWGLRNYIPERHDPLIWNHLSRSRKKTGFRILIDDSGIALDGVLVTEAM